MEKQRHEYSMDATTMKSHLLKCHEMFFAILFCLGASSTFAGGIGVNEWGNVTNDVMMSVKLESADPAIKTNALFNVLICLTNLSDSRTLTWYQPLAPTADDPYVFVIISPSGKDVSPAKSRVPVRGSGALVSVGPHQMHEANLKLSDICIFSEAGTYKIIVKQDIGELKHPCWLVSNPLSISVAAGDAKRDATNTPPTGF